MRTTHSVSCPSSGTMVTWLSGTLQEASRTCINCTFFILYGLLDVSLVKGADQQFKKSVVCNQYFTV